jgi:uncharacterized protein (DUF4415 family)
MKRASSSKTSKAKIPRTRKMKDVKIRLTTEHPEASTAYIMRGIVRQGLQPMRGKTSISLRLDTDVLEWYKAQGPGYQTRINSVLRAFKDASA